MGIDIERIIALDVETSGFSKGEDITLNYQIVSIGLIIADKDFKEIDKFYCEIKWNGISQWDKYAEKIHGLSKEYLDEHGMNEEDAVMAITEFLLKHFQSDEYLFFLGHNPRNFDIPFFTKLTNKYDVHFKIAHRTIDSFSVGFTALGAQNSDELFEYFYDTRKKHNALDDANMSLGVCRRIKKIIKASIDE